MSDKLKQLRDKRNNLAGEANQLNNKYDADTRMPKDELNKLNGILDEISTIDAEIRAEERMAEAALDNFDQGEHENSMRDKYTRESGRQANESSFVRAFLQNGLQGLTPEEQQAMHNRTPLDLRNAMSTTTQSEGGYTVAEEWMRQLQVAMKAYGGMYSVAEIMRTATGATLNMPTADPTSEEGEIVGENQSVSKADTTFGNKTLGSFMYSSKSIALPWQLLQDSMFDLDAYIMDLLAMRIGRITNRHFTVGTGSGQPEGIVTGAGQGKVGKSGQTLTVTYDDLVALEHSIDPAYRNQAGVGFMFHDSTLEQIRLIKDKNDRPIFVPGYEQGNPGGAPDRLLNRPITINQHMDPMGASKKSILFGQLNKYKIRQVMDTRLFRMTDSAYTEKAQVGFIGFQRADGKLIDVGGAVKYYQNSAS